VKTLPASARRSCELRLQIALGASIIGLRGYGAPEVETTFARAQELCAGLGDSRELFQALAGLRAYHFARARLNVASHLCQQLSELASRIDDPKLRLSVHHVETVNSFYIGHLTNVPHCCEQVLARYDPQRRSERGIFVADVAVESLTYCAHALWALGYPDRANEKMIAAIALARKTGNLFGLCITGHFEILLYLKRRQPELTAQPINVLSTVARERGFAFWSIHALMWEGWHKICVTGETSPDDLDLLRKALADLRAQGSDLVHPFWSTVIARCLAARRKIAEAIELLDNALAEVVRVGSGVWEPEFLCLIGDMLRTSDATKLERTERSYQLAINVAQSQSARMWELRAAAGLARLWRDQGKRHKARELLTPVYGWFTEGFDTLDLKEAKALLDELSS
jgi:predicted ATPase